MAVNTLYSSGNFLLVYPHKQILEQRADNINHHKNGKAPSSEKVDGHYGQEG